MTHSLDLDDVLSLLREQAEAQSLSAWARKHGISVAYLSDTLGGRRKPGPAILRGLGLQKVVRYQSTINKRSSYE